jgi:RNA polymerase sigma-70 factor (ECF subfamily)
MTVPETVETQTYPDPSATETEAERLRALTPEEAERFGAEFASLQPGLYGFALKLTRNHDDAEDLVQETFSKALPHYPSFVDRGHGLSPWLKTIATNLRINRARHDKILTIVPTAFETEDPDGKVVAIEPSEEKACWVTPSNQPEDIVADKDFAVRMLDALLHRFDDRPQTRQMIERSLGSMFLSDVGYTDDEVAALFGVPTSTIRTGNRRVRKHASRSGIYESATA